MDPRLRTRAGMRKDLTYAHVIGHVARIPKKVREVISAYHATGQTPQRPANDHVVCITYMSTLNWSRSAVEAAAELS